MKKKEINEIKEQLKQFDERIKEHDEKIELIERTLSFLSDYKETDIILDNTTCYMTVSATLTYICNGLLHQSIPFDLPGTPTYYSCFPGKDEVEYKVLKSDNEVGLIQVIRGKHIAYYQLFKLTGEVVDVTCTAEVFLESINELISKTAKSTKGEKEWIK